MLTASRWTGVMALIASLGAMSQAGAQAFAEVKTALVDYSKADMTPRRTCDRIASRKWRKSSRSRPPWSRRRGRCPHSAALRGTIKPEVAFEVTLPERWNGRFYMIGNGGHAG